MSKADPFLPFEEYVLRVPLFSFTSYEKLTENYNITDSELQKYCKNSTFKEALFLASPSMYEASEKWINGEITDTKKVENLRTSLLKYISRISSRCTPFGLFAGCSVGEISDNTNIELEELQNYKRLTRLDMNYLISLYQNILTDKKIRHQLKFHPNSSLYPAGNKFRFVEYYYNYNRRFHKVSEIDYDENISMILTKASGGIKFSEIIKFLIELGFPENDSVDFIDILIENQILISELEPSISGPDYFQQILNSLKDKSGAEEIVMVLKEVEVALTKIDQEAGDHYLHYKQISKILRKLNTKINSQFLFQTDLVVETKKNNLDTDLVEKLKKGLSILNRISLPPKNTLFTNFLEAFSERYGGREVPLANALDIEIGIGYKQDLDAGENNPLINDLIFTRANNKDRSYAKNLSWSSVDSVFQRILIKNLKEKKYTISLEDKDFANFPLNWDDLPDTFSVMTEILIENGEKKIKFDGAGGPTAAKLFSRFCYSDKNLYKFVNKIIKRETEAQKDKLIAEIGHLPEARVGNVLMKPDFRNYEIPYLARSLKPYKFQLPLDDLTIKLNNRNKIVLKSKKFKKEVIPRLTNAHNYHENSLPIYHFLGDLQFQDLRGGFNFDLGPFQEDYEFLPRIEYYNIILHSATWNLRKEQISILLANVKDDKNLLKETEVFKNKFRLPQYVLLNEGDKKLLINLNNVDSIKMWLNSIRNKANFKLTEFLHNSESIVKRKNENFVNQIFISFYRE